MRVIEQNKVSRARRARLLLPNERAPITRLLDLERSSESFNELIQRLLIVYLDDVFGFAMGALA